MLGASDLLMLIKKKRKWRFVCFDFLRGDQKPKQLLIVRSEKKRERQKEEREKWKHPSSLRSNPITWVGTTRYINDGPVLCHWIREEVTTLFTLTNSDELHGKEKKSCRGGGTLWLAAGGRGWLHHRFSPSGCGGRRWLFLCALAPQHSEQKAWIRTWWRPPAVLPGYAWDVAARATPTHTRTRTHMRALTRTMSKMKRDGDSSAWDKMHKTARLKSTEP